MKKIVGIIAAVAMAASMFAVDFTANAKSTLTVFDMATTEGAKPTVLSLDDGNANDQSKVEVKMNGDKAGVSFRFQANKGQIDNYGLWYKPIDELKIAYQEGAAFAMNQETLSYYKFNVLKASSVISATITPINGLTINVGATNPMVNAGNVNEIAAKVAYGADFGTISAMYVYNPDTSAWTHDGAKALLGKNAFAVGYAGNFGAVSIFSDVSLSMADALKTVFADVDVKFAQDAFGIQAYAEFKRYNMDTTAANKVVLWTKATYNFGAATGYIDFCDEDLLADNFAAVISAGATFNIGVAGMDASVKYDCGAKKISVPLTTQISL